MANAIFTTKSIAVHGRGSLREVFTLWADNTQTTKVSLAERTVYFEVDGASLHILMGPSPDDPDSLLIALTNDQVSLLKTKPLPCSICDVTDALYPVVLWSGEISRFGYIGEPDGEVG